MGFLANYRNKSTTIPGSQGRQAWNQIFGSRTKEDLDGTHQPPVRGGSYGRQSIAAPEATKRLIQALRSMAPGGWSDNRWEQSQHFKGITYVGVDRVCKQYLMSEFKLYVKDPTHVDGRRLVVPEDPPMTQELAMKGVRPYDLVKLLERPNRQDGWGMMMYRIGQQLKLTGMALNWMLPNALGTPMEMYVIPTSIAIPQPAINPDYPDGYYRIQPVYPYGPFSSYPTPATAVGAPIPAQWMLRFLYAHPILRYDGYSPLTAMNLHIDEVEMMDRSRFYKMKGSVNPTAVLNPGQIEGFEALPQEEIDRMHVEWEQYQGPENHGKLIVGTPGGKIEEFGSRPIDMEYVEGWEQLTSFVLGGGFGISKPAAGMVEAATYSNLFSTLKQLVLLTMDPDFALIGETLTHDLAPFFGVGLQIEIKARRIDDHEIIFNKIQSGMAAKCITKNQVLKMLELPTTEELWGMDIAGDPSPMENANIAAEIEAMAQAGPPGMEGGAPGEGGPPGSNKQPEGAPGTEEPAIKASRPEPSRTLSGGGLGVAKSLNGRIKGIDLDVILGRKSKKKTVYEQMKEAVSNGHSK